MDKELLRTPKFKVVQKVDSTGSSAIIRHPGAVVILPLVGGDQICLISNRRKAVNRTLIELPAGTREPNETPLETAERELTEETGYRAKSMQPLFDYFVSPGILDERMYSFVAEGLEPGPKQLMDDEDIETMVVPFSDAIDWIRQGKIEDAKSIATLLYFWQFQKDVR